MFGLGGSMPSLGGVRHGLQMSAVQDPMSSSMGGQLGPGGGMNTMFGIQRANQDIAGMMGGFGKSGMTGIGYRNGGF